MKLRVYKDSDYEDIKFLLNEEGLAASLPNKEDMDGIGIVALLDSKLVGFVWAVIGKKGKSAYVDFFCVNEANRGKKEVGPSLMISLFSLMNELKVINVYGVLPDADYTDFLAKIYKHVGMTVCDARFTVHGNVTSILKAMKGRYK